MKEKLSFDTYINEVSNGRHVSYGPYAMDLFEQAYNLGVGLAPFFSSSEVYSDEELFDKLNLKLLKSFRIQFHNIGKDPYQKFYDMNTHFDWLKVEHYLIGHFYAIRNNNNKKSESYISNLRIAINMGWLSRFEENKNIISRASRRVTEALSILKNIRGTIQVEHLHRSGNNGSYHRITPNWFVIIPLYRSYNPDKAITIRERKGIRYRIISLLHKAAKSFSQGLRKLMKMQKDKYLQAITTMDLDKFQDSRFWFKYIMDRYDKEWHQITPFKNRTPADLVPEYEHPNLTLYVKDEELFDTIHKASNIVLSEVLEKDFNIHLTIVPQF